MLEINLVKQSKFVFTLAFIIEIGVVIIGLGISLATALSVVESQGSFTMIFVAAAPFVMVALCELSKIPIAVAVWFSFRSKILYILLMLFVCLITFETLFNGFERNFAALSFSAKRMEITKDSFIAKIEDNNEKINNLKSEYVTEEKELNNQSKIIEQQAKAFKAQAKAVSSTSSKSLSSSQSKLEGLLIQREELINQKSILLNELAEKKQAALADMQESSSSKEGVRQDQIASVEKKIASLNTAMEVAIADAFLSTSKTRIRKEYAPQIATLQSRLNQLVDGGFEENNNASFSFSAIEEQYRLMIGIVDGKLKRNDSDIKSTDKQVSQLSRIQSTSLNQKIAQIEKSSNIKLKEIKQETVQLDTKFETSLQKIEGINEENFAIRDKIRLIETDIEQLYLSNQIYRMAAHVQGTDKLSEIKPSTVTLVSVVWFGSLAAICALIGPLLVITSIHLRSIHLKRESTQLLEKQAVNV